MSSIFAGQIVGTLFFGPLADRIGRKPVYLGVTTLCATFGLLTAAANTYSVLLVLRVLVGVGSGGSTVIVDLVSEMTPAKSRGNGMVVLFVLWIGGILYAVGVANATLGTSGDIESNPSGWRYLALAASVPVILSLIMTLTRVPESPRWLLAHGKADRALEILRQAAKSNGKDPDECFPAGTLLAEGQEQESGDVRELFRPKWRKTTMALWIVDAAVAFGYSAVQQLSVKIFSSTTTTTVSVSATTYTFDYLPMYVNTAAESIGAAIILWAVDKFGRVKTMQLSIFLAGWALLGCSIITQRGTAPLAVGIVISFVARLLFLSSLVTLLIYVPELLPTKLRATGHALSNVATMVGSFASPYLLFVGLDLIEAGVVFLVVSLLAVLAAWQLPETLGQEMGRVVDTAELEVVGQENEDESNEA